MALPVPRAHPVVADAKAFGPKMRALAPRHRLFVTEYVRCRNATEAARVAGYRQGIASTQANGRGKGSNLRKTASELLARQDVSDAVVEETLRRLKADLPVHLDLVARLADGRAGTEERPVSHAVQLKALELVVNKAAPDTLKIEQDVKVEVTVNERWERLCRMAVARGEDPEAVLRNLPPEQQAVIRAALEHKAAVVGATPAEFEEVQE